ncbi:hypothetical protein OTB20_34350 [Streptomyces sp. H27-H1]|uniref:hypothetical protein n=1 Tax=Streptomyces sp. H27-H1 TaxID=2996461 RepID=UPI002270F8DA|nr:hypothetical protein [Streptomyces sp. H27-H1]MCY0931177.1 hypothetical protein [Streptomyces sp. H27-H1]
MNTKAIDGKTAGGVRLLIDVMRHAPSSVLPTGRWLTESSAGRLMDAEGGVWFMGDGGLAVERMLQLPCPCAHWELTTYQDGAEIFRRVGPIS